MVCGGRQTKTHEQLSHLLAVNAAIAVDNTGATIIVIERKALVLLDLVEDQVNVVRRVAR